MTTLDTATIRRNTADILRQRGWIKDDYLADLGNPGRCSLCLVEAIGQAAGLPPLALSLGSRPRVQEANPNLSDQFAAADDTIDELATALGRKPSNVQPSRDWLMDWNDEDGRIFDDVLAALEAGEATQ
ncbi:hypothetical protein ABZ912_29910 [Nonomuraea angiospora]|uniref:DUF6197 family protein n=1 Tax=Nonomuraea angiospora TaxID=46172 RepID=UPI0033D38018